MPENPFGYGILGLIVVMWLTGWLYSKSAFQREVERGDKWENVAKQKDMTIATQAETIREFTELGKLLKQVLEGPSQTERLPRRRTT